MSKEPTKRPRGTNGATDLDLPKVFSLTKAQSQIELELVHINGLDTDGPWCMVKFWTHNTIYRIDSSFRCIEVKDRHGRSAMSDDLIGAKLAGSQAFEHEHFSVSFPYPIPGMQAVFGIPRSEKFTTTSTVERVVLRVRITNMNLADGVVPDWSKITKVGRAPSR